MVKAQESISPSSMPQTAAQQAYASPSGTKIPANRKIAAMRTACSSTCETAGTTVSCIPRKKPRKQEPAAIKGTASASRRRESAARESFRKSWAVSSAKKNSPPPTSRLSKSDSVTACLTTLPILPLCPRIFSCAVRREIVVVNPAEVMLHARE